MKAKVFPIVVLALAGVLAGMQPSRAEEIARLGLEDLDQLGLTLAVDQTQKTEGGAALKIRTLWPVSVCLGQVGAIDAESARLIFKARVRTRLQGEAFLEMWCHFGGKAYFSKGLNDPARGDSEWRQLETPFILQKGQNPDKITLNLVINGHGTVWVDDVVVVKDPL